MVRAIRSRGSSGLPHETVVAAKSRPSRIKLTVLGRRKKTPGKPISGFVGHFIIMNANTVFFNSFLVKNLRITSSLMHPKALLNRTLYLVLKFFILTSLLFSPIHSSVSNVISIWPTLFSIERLDFFWD